MTSSTFSFLYTTSDNYSIGRLDYGHLSDQTRMELFVADAATPNEFRDPDGFFLEIDRWPGLGFNSGAVSSIGFYEQLGNGRLQFEALPPTIRKISIGITECTGEVPWGKLSNAIRYLTLFEANFHGSVDLTVAPRELYSLILENTRFSGTLDFGCLPDNLIVLLVTGNAFTGRVDIQPIETDICEVTYEHLEIAWGMLVPNLHMPFGIDVRNNQFSGDILVRNVEVVTDEGQFSGNACGFLVDTKGGRKAINGSLG